MLIFPEFRPVEVPIRSHPWNVTQYANGGGRYYNFIANPELIPEVLEDFKPHAHRPAVQMFYDFLRWINHPDGNLETNDCAMRSPHQHDDTIFRKDLRIDGRLDIFSREHIYNTKPYADTFFWLPRMLSVYLQVAKPNFYEGKVTIGVRPTYYKLLDGIPRNERFGYRMSLIFAAYGSSENEVFDNLRIVFEGIWEASKRLSAAMKVETPEFP